MAPERGKSTLRQFLYISFGKDLPAKLFFLFAAALSISLAGWPKGLGYALAMGIFLACVFFLEAIFCLLTGELTGKQREKSNK